MARIVLATLGSLGDLHPKIALAVELDRRGHEAVIASWEGYREKADALGLGFSPLRPDIDPTDKELTKRAMDPRTGPETVIRDIVLPNIADLHADLTAACKVADLMVTGELIYSAGTLVEQTGIKWISTSLAPISMFSAEDPNVYPTAEFLEHLRPLPAFFHRSLFEVMKWTVRDWLDPFREFRRKLGLSTDVDPVFRDKFSRRLHLAMFSRALAKPQSDWFSPTLQTGFAFYDESTSSTLPDGMEEFLANGEPPIVFTLGSAASLDAGDFFEQSAAAARRLGRRAVLLYGRDCERPNVTDGNIGIWEFAPYSLVFPHAACVVHQGGVGTTGQALRSGRPQIIVPFSHDQPDNAARCRRAGLAEVISRASYNAGTAAAVIEQVLSKVSYTDNAAAARRIVEAENGTKLACDAIEDILRK